jgi:hypothetical protein
VAEDDKNGECSEGGRSENVDVEVARGRETEDSRRTAA